MEVLNPSKEPIGSSWPEENDNVLVLRLMHGQVSFVFTTDIEALAENYLVRHAPSLSTSVLQDSPPWEPHLHHPRFLSQVDPTVAVISSGSTNQYGHPHGDVVGRLEETVGVDGLYRTDRDGSIEFISDGDRLWVRTER